MYASATGANSAISFLNSVASNNSAFNGQVAVAYLLHFRGRAILSTVCQFAGGGGLFASTAGANSVISFVDCSVMNNLVFEFGASGVLH